MDSDEDLIQPLVDWWQGVLNLSDWRITWKIVDDTKLKHSLMEIRPTSVRHHATIFIRTSTIKIASVEEFEKLLVHELVHLIYDPLAEEHKIELEFMDSLSRQKEYRMRFIHTLEKAVEHTAQMVCARVTALPLPFDHFISKADEEEEQTLS